MANTANNQGVPTTNQPFVDKNNRITIAWYRFLITLWRRTGGTLGTLIDTGSSGGFTYLRISGNSNTLININAAVAVLSSENGDTARFRNVVGTLSLDARGINGMDAVSSRGSNRVVYLFLISDGTDLATLASNFFVPVLPDGYTYSMLVGVIRLDDQGDLYPFIQINDLVNYYNILVEADTQLLVGLTTRQVKVPPNVFWMGNANVSGNNDGASVVLMLRSPLLGSLGVGVTGGPGFNAGMGLGLQPFGRVESGSDISDVLVDSDSQVAIITGGFSVTNSIVYNLNTVGYRIPFLGV